MAVRDEFAARDLIARFGSPLYVYDAERVRRNYENFRAAFSCAPFETHFAIVCNKNRLLVRTLHELGAGIHANTPGDAFAAMAAGVPPGRIVYSGTNLSEADFEFLISRGIRMNLDSLDQLRDAAKFGAREAGLRFLIDDENHPNRIGVAADELAVALEFAKRSGVRITGLHMYAGTNTRRTERFLECFDRMIEASSRLPDLEFLDGGGGYGVSYEDRQSPLDLESLGAAISERMTTISARRGRPIRLILEPGRTLVADAGVLLATVVSAKERGGRRYIGVDTTVGNIVVPSVYHERHRIVPVSPRGPAIEIPADVCGNTTHSRDFLGRDLRLPHLQPGDLLKIEDVGAYGYAMSSHFLNRPRPAEVVLDRGEAHLTTRRETFEDLLATQLEIQPGG